MKSCDDMFDGIFAKNKCNWRIAVGVIFVESFQGPFQNYYFVKIQPVW